MSCEKWFRSKRYSYSQRNQERSESGEVLNLLDEARALHTKSRQKLAEFELLTSEPITTSTESTKGTVKMTEITNQAAAAAQLYSAGKPVVEVAKELGITYGKARRLINESGTPIRDASSRLKGRTRPVK
jgi:hypothetical protein